MKPAFYDPFLSYEDNYAKGPPIDFQNITPAKREKKKMYDFLGFRVSLPFGIPPGPLLNSKYMKAAFHWGYDVSTYKTVRAIEFPSHPFPNVLPVKVTNTELHPDKTPRLVADKAFSKDPTMFSITNSFGVPSKTPSFWQQDVKRALSFVRDGQLMILSFMGTVKEGQTQEEFIDDFSTAGQLSAETGVKIVEANLSCPNIGNEGLVCYNLEATKKVCKAIRARIGNLPLILKVGYYQNEEDMYNLSEIANKYAQAIATINTLQVEVVDQHGNQALPGKNRLRSGICGASIKWAGLEMTKKLYNIRKEKNYDFSIVGIGGVMTADDYLEYKDAGADLVQSATGAMWNPHLAYLIEQKENNL